MSITNNQGTLPQRAINITVLITVLFWFPLTVLAATSTLNDYNPYNVNIPDNGSSVNSDLALSGAPNGATITKVKVYYEIRHTYIGDLKVWLTTYYDGAWHDFVLKNREGGSTDNIIETRDNLTTWNGASPNQTWYLVAQDMATGDTGYIDFFELWVTYSVNDPPNTPSSEDPSDGATGVSINKDLDWSCSDPNSDTLYYTVYFEKNDSSPDNVIKSDATGSAADPGTLDYDAHYYWQVKADDHKGGVTWSHVWDFYTEPTPVVDANITGVSFDRSQVKRGVQTITATVTLRNTGNQTWTFYVGGSSIKSGDSTWYDWSPARASKSLPPNESGTVQLTWSTPADAPLGMYGFFSKIFKYSTGDEFVDDDWRDLVFEVIDPVNSGQITGVSFNKTSVIRGQETITATVTIQNTGDQSYTFYLGGSSIKTGDTTWYDWTPSRASKMINAGQSDTVTVSWLPPSGAPLGTYGFYSKLFKANSGTDYFDDDWRDSAFQVQEAPLPTLTGRLAFHRDSNNTSLHAPSTADDGHVFIYNLAGGAPLKATSGFTFGNAMNPHFSPNGSKLTFMAIPSGQSLLWDNMRVYVLDLAENLLSNLGVGQDPKFSPDGSVIVFKRSGQIWRMQSDGSSGVQLTTATGEKSGPNYSPDGYHIVYWLNGGANADIWHMNADGSGPVSLVANVGIQDYYPIFRDANNILYARWDSSIAPHPDKIYNIEVSTGTSTKLGLNSAGTAYEDADAFPVADFIGFSSTRKSGWPDYDLYIAGASGSPFGEISASNSTLGELGGTYSPYTYARKLKVQAPASGATLTAGASYTLQVRAYSDGAIWSGTSPSVTFHGPTPQTYSALRDDGTAGDAVSGDGIYSRTITLPASSGDYTITAGAQSVEPGVTRQVSSVPITATVMVTGVPTVTTTAVSSIASNSASSGGNVTSNGGASVTARGVCWSTSANPTTSDSHTSDGTGTGSFTSSITELSPNTTYHVRAYATNSEGTGYGSDQAFITLANAPGTASFSNVTQTNIRANWTANGNPSGTEYLCENTSNGTDSGWTTDVYWNCMGLACGTTYSFRIKARNGDGIETGSTELGSQSTQGCSGDTTPPTPNPMTWSKGPYATGQTSIRMVATTASDVSGVEYYFQETSGNPGGSDSGWQASPEYENTGLNPGTAYSYRVKARDKSPNHNETAYSVLRSVTTQTSAVTRIAVVNPDTYRILKMGALNDSGNFYSIASGSIADGDDFTDPADWTGVGEQQDFISTILTNAGYEVDQFEASVLPSISNADYQVVIVQDPLRTNVRSFSKESEHNLPDLLEYTTDATFLAKLEAYFDSGGQVIFVGDAVRLLEDGPGRLNWGKSVIDMSVFNNPSQDDPRLADHWLFIRGNPFCGIDRNGSGQYLVHLSTLVNSGTVLSDITLFNGNDLPWSSCWSDTFYYPEDGTSLLSVDVTGTGEYVLSSATCNPPVYNDTVNETLLHLIGYTHHNGKKVFYIGSDSFFDYHYVNHEGAWHAGEYHSIQCSVTEAGKEAIVRLVQNATERKAKAMPWLQLLLLDE